MSDGRLFFPATERNRDAILEVLRRVLPPQGAVLEIGSGSGEHVAHFAASLPELRFIPTDPDESHRHSVSAWTRHLGLTNVATPLMLDAAAGSWPVDAVDAVFCANVIHISPWEVTRGLVTGAAARLAPGAPLILYGPFRREGRHTAPSNEHFDDSLRARDQRWGVRDLEAVSELAAEHGLMLDETVSMPANNLTVVWRRGG